MLEVKEGLTPPRRPAPEEAKLFLTQHALEEHEGYYETSLGLTKVVARGGYLEFKAAGQAVRAYPRRGGTFALEFRLFGLVPIGIEDIEKMNISFARVNGRDLIVAHKDGRKMLFGAKLKPRAIPEAWAKRAGRYELVNRGDDQLYVDDVRLFVEDGVLGIEFAVPSISKQHMRMGLDPVGDLEAITQGLGRNKGETMRVITRDGKEALTYSGFIYVKK